MFFYTCLCFCYISIALFQSDRFLLYALALSFRSFYEPVFHLNLYFAALLYYLAFIFISSYRTLPDAKIRKFSFWYHSHETSLFSGNSFLEHCPDSPVQLLLHTGAFCRSVSLLLNACKYYCSSDFVFFLCLHSSFLKNCFFQQMFTFNIYKLHVSNSHYVTLLVIYSHTLSIAYILLRTSVSRSDGLFQVIL